MTRTRGWGLRRLHTAELLARPVSAPGLRLCLLLITSRGHLRYQLLLVGLQGPLAA